MTESEIDRAALAAELDQIKQAVGMQEEYPYYWRWWLVQGIASAMLLPLIDLNRHTVWDPLPALGATIGVVVLLAVDQMTRSSYDEPVTGIPNYWSWHLPIFAGIVAVLVGFAPFWGQLGAGDLYLGVVVVTAGFLGVGFLYLGQLLASYHIRMVDRSAFYLGGCLSLALAALLPQLPQLNEWPLTAVGLVWGAYCLIVYAVLPRR